MSRKTLLYISGPITPTEKYPDINANLKRLCDKAFELFLHGYSVYCPAQLWIDQNKQVMAVMSKNHYGKLYEDVMEMDMEIIRRCDALYLLKGFQHSKGAVREHNHAQLLGKPIYYEE